MEFKTHQAAGFLAAGLLITHYQIPLGLFWLQIAAASTIGAALPDIDHSNSAAAQAVPVAGYVTGKTLKHRGPITHSIWTLVIGGGILYAFHLPKILIIAFLVGIYFGHHLLDKLTEQRLKWLWPLQIDILPLPSVFSIRTGSFMEKKLVRPALWLASIFVWFNVTVANKHVFVAYIKTLF